MSRVTVTDEAEDMLFRVFDAAQGAERRIFRIIARRQFNELALREIRFQLEGALGELADLEKLSDDPQ